MDSSKRRFYGLFMCPINTILIILAQKSDNCFKKCFLIVAFVKSLFLEKLKQVTKSKSKTNKSKTTKSKTMFSLLHLQFFSWERIYEDFKNEDFMDSSCVLTKILWTLHDEDFMDSSFMTKILWTLQNEDFMDSSCVL